MTFVDFEQLKQEVTIDQAITWLRLYMKEKNGQFRGVCPTCKTGGPRALAITPAKSSYYCFGNGKGGDVISLVSHIRNVPMKDAAQWLADHSGHSSPKSANQPAKKLETLSNLEHDHEAVIAVGLDTAVAQRLGIGFRTKGAGQGSVMIPVRNDQGEVEGWLGVQELTYIPKDFMPPENVLPFKKKA